MRGGCERGRIGFGPSSGRGPEGLRSRSHREGTGQVIPRGEGRASAGVDDIAAMIQGGALCTYRLQQDGVSMKIEELLLAAGEGAHVNNLLGIDAHSFEG